MGQYPIVLRVKANSEEEAIQLAVEWGEDIGCQSCFDYSSSEGEIVICDPKDLRKEELRRHAQLLAEASEGEMDLQKSYKLILAGEAFDENDIYSPERLYYNAADDLDYIDEGSNEYFVKIYRHI